MGQSASVPAILNLGAGNRIVVRRGAVNHDIVKHRPEIDVTWDLNQRPWPWADNIFDEIQAVSVFEHLQISLIEACNECWRMLRPGGRLVIKFPMWNGPTTHDDPTHRWYWSDKALDYLDPTTRPGREYGKAYDVRPWAIVARGIIKQRNVKAILEPRK